MLAMRPPARCILSAAIVQPSCRTYQPRAMKSLVVGVQRSCFCLVCWPAHPLGLWRRAIHPMTIAAQGAINLLRLPLGASHSVFTLGRIAQPIRASTPEAMTAKRQIELYSATILTVSDDGIVEKPDSLVCIGPLQMLSDGSWRKRVGVEPTQDRLRPLPGLKSGRPTGSDSLPFFPDCDVSGRSPARYGASGWTYGLRLLSRPRFNYR